jgi:hypothetical protein
MSADASDERPISYLALEAGVPVLSSGGAELGRVATVVQDDGLDIFTGIVVETARGRRFVAADHVGAITTARVETDLGDDAAEHLPEPDGEPVVKVDPADAERGGPLL